MVSTALGRRLLGRTPRRTSQWLRRVRTMATSTAWLARLATALVALVLAHNVVFLAAYGRRYEEALVQTGHGAAWTTAFTVVPCLGLALLALGAWQLRRLSRQARSLVIGAALRDPGLGAFAAHLGRLWLGLTASTVALFVAQENLEHVALGDPLPGIGVLARNGSPVAMTVIAAVALGVALVGALYRWRRDVLIARIAASRGRWRLQRAEPRRSQEADRRPQRALGGSIAGRAPPAGSRP